MQFIPILFVIDAMVSGTLWMGTQHVDGGTVTFHNATTSVSAPVDDSGKYSINVPAGDYGIRIQRTMNGRKKTLEYKTIRLADGANSIDLSWPSVDDAEARSALVRQHFDAGRAAHAAGRYADASVHFMDALREDVSQHAAWSALALSQAMAGEFDAAEKSLASGLMWGAGANSASNLANAYYRAGRFEQAGAKYEAAAAMDASRAATYYANAGAAYFAGRMNNQAEAAYKKAANASGSPSTNWYFWGVTAQSNGNRTDALAALRQYLQVDGSGRYASDARQRISAMGG